MHPCLDAQRVCVKASLKSLPMFQSHFQDVAQQMQGCHMMLLECCTSCSSKASALRAPMSALNKTLCVIPSPGRSLVQQQLHGM